MVKLTPLRISIIGIVALILAGIFFNSRTIGETLLNRSGATTTINTALSANPELSKGLVGYWTLDGSDVVSNVTDTSGNGRNAHLIGFTSTTTVSGRLGQGLEFDGSDDYVSIPSSVLSSVTGSTITVSMWIYPTSFGSYKAVFDTANRHASLFINAAGDGWVNFGSGSGAAITFSSVFTLDEWQHVVVTYNGTTIKTYRNGVQNGSVNTGLSTFSEEMRIGANPSTGGSAFVGKQDDIRVYNRTLSASEIERLYGLGAPGRIGAGSSDGPVKRDKIPFRSIIGAWTFDGADLIQNVADSSGSDNEGYVYGGTTTIQGKFGQGLSLAESTGQYIEVSTMTEIGANQDLTVSVWARATSPGPDGEWPIVVSKEKCCTGRQGYSIGFTNTTNDPRWFFDIFSGGVQQSPTAYGASDIRDGNWHHLVGIRQGGTLITYEDGMLASTVSALTGSLINTDAPLTFGRSAGTNDSRFYYTGDIDDVRIWNRALSAGEVRRLFELGGKPNVNLSARRDAHWTLDTADMSNNVSDTTGNGHTGYLLGQTSTTTVTGVFGEALNLDGSNDYVNIPSYSIPTANGTLSVWFYLNENLTDTPLFDSRLASPLRIFDFYFFSGTLYAGWYNNGNDDRIAWSASSVTQGAWHHGAVSWVNGGTTRLFIDGVQVKANTNSLDATWDTATGNTYIARASGNTSNYAQAYIDDVRVYSRTLSPYEIRRIYETGR